MAQNSAQTVLLLGWVGPSALDRVVVSSPGALPQAGMDRAFGPPGIVQVVNPHLEIRTKAPKPGMNRAFGPLEMVQIANSHLEVRTKAPKARTITAWGSAPGRGPTA